MTTSLRRRCVRLVVAALTTFAVLATLTTHANAAPGASPQSGRHTTVMTRNLYLGADFTTLLAPGVDLTAGVLNILASVQFSQPAVRMQQVAAEIHANSPDVVALQEAANWTSAVPGVPFLQYSYDFADMVVADLHALGDEYSIAVDRANFDSYNDLAVGPLLPGRFVDHDVILVKSAARVVETGGAHFASQLTYPTTPIGPVTFTRGYDWADIKIPQGKVYRVVDVHFEAYSGTVAGDQAAELLAALTETRNPTIIAGDMNSDPNADNAQAANAITAAGYADAWTVVHPTLPGYTCCEDGALVGPPDGSALNQRIDHVYSRGQAMAESASLVGVTAFRAAPPMWPSDHAGLVASFAVGNADS